MNKKMMLAAVLVNMVMAVFGTDFEERISRNIWYRDYFNEVIYRKDRNIIVEYQPYLTEEENISFYDGAYDDMIYWFTESAFYRDHIELVKLDDVEYSYFIHIGYGGYEYKAKELTSDLYELEIKDVRISQSHYEDLLER